MCARAGARQSVWSCQPYIYVCKVESFTRSDGAGKRACCGHLVLSSPSSSLAPHTHAYAHTHDAINSTTECMRVVCVCVCVCLRVFAYTACTIVHSLGAGAEFNAIIWGYGATRARVVASDTQLYVRQHKICARAYTAYAVFIRTNAFGCTNFTRALVFDIHAHKCSPSRAHTHTHNDIGTGV